MKALLYGVCGGLFSFIMILLLQNLLKGTDVQSFIFFGTITLSIIICACTGILVETLKDTKGNS